MRKIFLLILIFTLGNCGYEPLHLKKNNTNLQIQSFQAEGNKKINRKIISSLNLKDQNKESGNKLVINSEKTIETISKDNASNASVYRTKITVKISLIDVDKILKEKTFIEDFTYNNTENKSNLAQYQNDIEINLINKIIEDIFIFLSI